MKIMRNILFAAMLLMLLSIAGKAGNLVHQPQNPFLTNADSFAFENWFRAEKFASDKKDWIYGVWQGTAFQVDAQTTWTIRFTAEKDKYMIEYPSLECGGEWYLIKGDKKKATFRENIIFGQDKCTDNGKAIIEKISEKQISFKFVDPGSPDVNSTAVLNRQ